MREQLSDSRDSLMTELFVKHDLTGYRLAFVPRKPVPTFADHPVTPSMRRPFETDQRSRSEPFMHHSADMRARIRNWPLLEREIAALCDSRATGGRD